MNGRNQEGTNVEKQRDSLDDVDAESIHADRLYTATVELN